MGVFITPRGTVDEDGHINTRDQGPWLDTVAPQTTAPEHDYEGSATVKTTDPTRYRNIIPDGATVDSTGVIRI